MTNTIAQDLCEYIAESPTPFHATKNLLALFTDNGFRHIHEDEDWAISSNESYVLRHSLA